ncbi:AMP-binding protein [Diaminobutyricibacter tongyongensis]|uniref:AMP-binding protein n=1 Tax=Leifsonia tongyongensis TaxID=1268043 RepID=A0A6L9Y4G8_9MICO|nr:AMP-binding protein [Diaminobutyricibacter tongyongensis]
MPQNVALVIETSGSTGVPKRVALSADALLASAAASASALGGQGQWLLALPAHYVAGVQVLVRSVAAGTDPVILSAGHFDPRAFADLAASMTGDARFVSLVPVQVARLLDVADQDRQLAGILNSFDGILVGGQALAPSLRERAELHGVTLTATYGSSETAGGCVYNGEPIGSTIVREEQGLLEIAGPTLAEGYLGDAERTDAAFHMDAGHRWYRTGDLGKVEHGRVVVSGRADNVIISGGEKVLLDAVEHAVRAQPGFERAVVVAQVSAEWGQVPVVVIDAAPPLDLPALRLAVGAVLGKAAAPARIVRVERLPMLASGKPDRVAIAGHVAMHPAS